MPPSICLFVSPFFFFQEKKKRKRKKKNDIFWHMLLYNNIVCIALLHIPYQQTTKTMSHHRNQYSGPLDKGKFVAKLLGCCTVEVWDELRVFSCLKPKGKGISTNSGGYCRVNYSGGKVVVHKMVLQVTKGPAPEDAALDASHLCGNPWCCRPSHLAWENRDDNISRRGCAGCVLVNDDSGGSSLWIHVCKHKHQHARLSPEVSPVTDHHQTIDV